MNKLLIALGFGLMAGAAFVPLAVSANPSLSNPGIPGGLHPGGPVPIKLHSPLPTPKPTPKPAPLPAGPRVINIDLTTQSATFYQGGHYLGKSLITSGMPGLRTPTGVYHIYAKYSPITFISSWPRSSRYYFHPEKANYAMRFRYGGLFLHNAPWEPANGFGPGSQNGPSASHGCVHFPTPVMAWLYKWAPLGTTVIIHY